MRLNRFVATLAAMTAFACAVAVASPMKEPFYAVEVDTHPGAAKYITLLPPDVFLSHGIPPESIVGQFTGESSEITSANFARNSVFVAFLHSFIERVGPQDNELQEQAKRIKNGTLALVDRRTRKPNAEPGNVFGAFTVVGGAIKSYVRNPEHRILADGGFFRLPPALEQKLIQELYVKAKVKK